MKTTPFVMVFIIRENMKNKFILFITFVIVLTSLIPINVSAYSYEYKEDDVVIDYLPGDVDGNYLLTAADARLCLRAAANLEILTTEQKKAADFDGSGIINSSNARRILRASAKIETVTVTVNLKVGQRFVAGPLNAPTGREWLYSLNRPNKFDVVVVTHSESGDKVGAAPYKYICFTAAETGSYTVNFEQQMGWNKKVYKDFSVVLNVS